MSDAADTSMQSLPSALTSPSFLARLPSSLLLLLTQYLPLRDKLCEWRHISRAAAAVLQPHSFTFDSLSFSSAALTAWQSSAALRELLSCMGTAVVRDDNTHLNDMRPTHQRVREMMNELLTGEDADEDEPSLFLAVMPPSSPSLPSAFRAIFHLLLPNLTKAAPQNCLAVIAQQQPRLEALRVGFNWAHNNEPEAPRLMAFWSPLSQMQSLRQLVISLLGLRMDYATFRLICSLPLTHLGVSRLMLANGAEEAKEEEEAKLDTWQ